MRKKSVKSFEFGPVVQELPFKAMLYISRALVVNCSADLNHLWNFGRRHHEGQFCELILNLNEWFRGKCV